MLCSSRHCSPKGQVGIEWFWLCSQLGLGCSLTDNMFQFELQVTVNTFYLSKLLLVFSDLFIFCFVGQIEFL